MLYSSLIEIIPAIPARAPFIIANETTMTIKSLLFSLFSFVHLLIPVADGL